MVLNSYCLVQRHPPRYTRTGTLVHQTTLFRPYLLLSCFTPLCARTVGMALTTVLILGQQAAGQTKVMFYRILFWVGLGLCTAVIYRYSGLRIEELAIIVIALLVVLTWFVKGGRETQRLLLLSFADAAKGALGVGVACALVRSEE